ncbi:SCO4848 family membrane protein [Kitasatospora sp. NPDC088548]|uniref:SCO4848 family membrane protein n=1 Tax=Kitasatospora sp. NPDC088548 TaxID=3364075 RepID=UPI00381BA011
MKLTRPVSWFLAVFGVWSWVIWSTFAKNLWKDSGGQAFVNGDHSQPTAFFWVHLLLAITSFILGTAVGVVGLRGILAARRSEK